MSKCSGCGEMTVVSDHSGTEKCRVCSNCGLVSKSDENLVHMSEDCNGTRIDVPLSFGSSVSVEQDISMRRIQYRSHDIQLNSMPKSVRFGAHSVNHAQAKEKRLLPDSEKTKRHSHKIGAAHKEIFRASMKWKLGPLRTGEAKELFDRVAIGNRFGPTKYEQVAVVCLYSVAKDAGEIIPLSEVLQMSGLTRGPFSKCLKKVKIKLAGGEESTNEDEPQETKVPMVKTPNRLLIQYSWNVAAKTFIPNVDLVSGRLTTPLCPQSAAFEKRLNQLAAQLEEFGKTRLHMERFGSTTGVVTAVCVYLAYWVLRPKIKLPPTVVIQSFQLSPGSLLNPHQLRRFADHFGLQPHSSAIKKLKELLDGLIVHANEFSWVANCDNDNILKHVETVMQRYKSLQVEIKVPPPLKPQAIVDLEDPVPFSHDLHSEDLCDEDISEADLVHYIKTEAEVNFICENSPVDSDVEESK